MGFNYAKEKAHFDREWVKLRREYTAAGMDTGKIQIMYDFDWADFLAARTYAIHTQPYPNEDIRECTEAERTTLCRKYSALSTTFNEGDFSCRYAWVDSIEDESRTRLLKRLCLSDLELLTLFVMEGYTQTEIAKMLGCDQSVISRKISRLKKYLK